MTVQEDKYYSVGFNHETSSLSLRETVTISEGELEAALTSLQRTNGIKESVILSTCNRTEIYSIADNIDSIFEWLISFRGLKKGQVDPFVYKHAGSQAAKHAFRVASGLDSMVLGETQILGQLKNAVRAADAAGTLGPKLRKLFDTSFSVAKQIRTETNVGAHSVSLSAASVKVAERIFGSLRELKVLFIGAGEMNRVCAEHFSSLGIESISIANRTLSRGRELADLFKGEYFSLTDVPNRLGEFDIVVSCTGSSTPIVGKRAIEVAVEYRRHKPILLVDLAVPRDFELEPSDLEDVFIYTIDDLGEIVKDGMRNRRESAHEAEKIIDGRLDKFNSQLDRVKRVPVIKKFRRHGEQIAQGELEKALAAIEKGEAPEKVLKTLSRAISNKFMDEPSRALSNDSSQEMSSLSEALERLFGLNKK